MSAKPATKPTTKAKPKTKINTKTRTSKTDGMARLWRQYRRTRAVDLRNQLVQHFMPIVKRLAEIMARARQELVPA